MAFRDSLATGKVAESQIARWLMRRGCLVSPVYEQAESKFEGPRMFAVENDVDRKFVAPDLLAFKLANKPGKRVFFVEAKCKSGFTWSRRYQRFETGIDRRHYRDYLEIRERTGIPLWILFLQKGGAVKDAPPDKPNSPRGLFGNEILTLADGISHEHDGWGPTGMVYWSPSHPFGKPALKRVAKYKEVCHPARLAVNLDEWA
jgi:hypothetical protein